MDIFDIHNMKMQKANAMLQYRQFKQIAKLFRLVELFSATVFFSWISFRLPFVIRVFADYFRHLISIVVNPLFIFLVGNVIILTLVLKSDKIDNPSNVDTTVSDLYEKIANNAPEDVPPPITVTQPEEIVIVYQDKGIVSEVNTNSSKIKSNQAMKKQNKPVPNSVPDLDLKTYRRSQSENLTKTERFLAADEVYGKLKRSETEIGRRTVEAPAEENDVVDELSDEEFNRRIEGFIAKQIKFHHEEKFAIVANL